MAVRSLILAAALHLAVGATRSSSAKWAQTKDTVIVVVPLKRGVGGKIQCTGETASVDAESRLVFSAQCGPDTYALDVGLQHPVGPELKLVANARRSECVITLEKQPPQEWSHLAADPAKYKRLIERDFSRGTSPADEED